MKIDEILKQEKEIWKNKMSLSEIIPAMGKIFGDICKWQRNAPKDKHEHIEEELKKEFGNLISSTIRWCDDFNFSPEECITFELESQKRFKK